MWDIPGVHKEQCWDPVLVVVDLISPLGLKSTRGKKGNESRGERIIDSRLPWEVSDLQSEENSQSKVTLQAETLGESDLIVPPPMISHWGFPLAETTQQLGGRKQIDEPTRPNNEDRDQVEKGRWEVWRGKRRDPAQALPGTKTIQWL